MRISEINRSALTRTLVDKLLYDSLEYSGERADLIIVLGSSKASRYRVPEAAKLYFAGRAEYLLFSGGKAQQTQYGFMQEYLSMLRAAKELGIPQDKIFCETKAFTTVENLDFSREIIRARLPECRRIILVTTAYHMRRAMLLAQRRLSEYEFVPCPANDMSAKRDNWFANAKGLEIVTDEVKRLQWYAENSLIEDIDVDIDI